MHRVYSKLFLAIFCCNPFPDRTVAMATSSVSKGRGAPGAPPYFRKGFFKNIYHLPIVKVDRKGLKVTLGRQSCFPGYRIIEMTANGSGLFEAIARHQLAHV